MLHFLVDHDTADIIHLNVIVAPHTAKGKDGNHRKDEAHSGNLPRLMDCGGKGNCLLGWRLRRALAMDFALSRFL
jgi:hypothetical protein